MGPRMLEGSTPDTGIAYVQQDEPDVPFYLQVGTETLARPVVADFESDRNPATNCSFEFR